MYKQLAHYFHKISQLRLNTINLIWSVGQIKVKAGEDFGLDFLLVMVNIGSIYDNLLLNFRFWTLIYPGFKKDKYSAAGGEGGGGT